MPYARLPTLYMKRNEKNPLLAEGIEQWLFPISCHCHGSSLASCIWNAGLRNRRTTTLPLNMQVVAWEQKSEVNCGDRRGGRATDSQILPGTSMPNTYAHLESFVIKITTDLSCFPGSCSWILQRSAALISSSFFKISFCKPEVQSWATDWFKFWKIKKANIQCQPTGLFPTG